MRSSFFFIYLPVLFPLYLVQFRLFGAPFTLLEIVIYLAFVVALVELFLTRKALPVARPFRHVFRGPVVPILLFFIAATLSLYMTSSDSVALGIWKGWVLPSVLFSIGFLWTVRDRKQVDTALLAYSFSATLLGLWALLQVFTDSYVTIDDRASGPFASANYLALFVAPAFLYLVLPGGGLSTLALRRFRIVGAIILFLALFFSQSYAAWIGVFLAFVLWALAHPSFETRGVRMSMVLSIVGAMVFLGFAAFLFHGDSYKFRDFLSFSRQSSSSVRMQVWTVSAELIREHPWWGIGMGQFSSQYEAQAATILGQDPYEATMLHPHNVFLATWLSTGLLGLIAFVWLVALFFVRTLGKLSTASLRLAVMMGVIVLHGLLDTSMWKNDLMPLFFLLAVVPFVLPLSKPVTRKRR